MANKADVKAMMARFQTGRVSTDESSSTPPGCIKQPLTSTFSTGPTIPTKKPVLESLSGSSINIPPKPSFLKNTASTKSDSEVNEPNMAKTLASRFASNQDDSNGNRKPFTVNKQQSTLKSPFLQPSGEGAKGPLQKPPPFNKPTPSSNLSDPKPTFPKPPPPLNSKPNWVKEDSGGGQPLKPSLLKLRQQNDELAGAGPNTSNKPSTLANTFKPPVNFRTAQNTFNKESDNSPVADDKPTNTSKPPLTATNSLPPPKPLASKKPSTKKPPKIFPQVSSITNDANSGPKKNPLPNNLALGPAPAKPNRPPKVDLESFKRGAVASDNGPGTLKKPILPISSHASNHSNHMTPPPPPQPLVPNLPPRHPGAMMQQDELYVEPPPLPPPTGHPSQRAKEENVDQDDDDDEQMYEALEERWDETEQKPDKQKEKDEKEEKKRLEAEKKQQKEREKKEQDARKKFKLVGSLDVIHQGKACVDCKGTKTDLALKQGDCLDIIRVQGNPEGKWVGRLQDGSIGYVKTTSVEIDFNTLKNCQSQELYDDIGVISSENSGNKGPGVVLPPLPGDGDGDEIYDDIDPNMDVSPTDSRSSPQKPRSLRQMFDWNRRPTSTKVVPPPEQFTAVGNSAIDDEIYDDVDTQNVPPPPPTSSLPLLKGKSKAQEMDQKKQKKFEKEEKEFRKKFKYEGEIQVLYQVTIVPTLTNKKWSGKELAVKAGEKLDVMVKAVDNKLICRNEEGKFGYVSTGYIFTDDGDIYDDIGDDCIYDND